MNKPIFWSFIVIIGGLFLVVVALSASSFSTTYAGQNGFDSSEPARHGTPVATLSATHEANLPGDTPTYYADVAPILAEHCISCHVEGGIASFPLNSAEDVHRHAKRIAKEVQQGSMPPWMPSELTPPLRHERKLTEDEIGILLAWAQADAPLGEPEEAPTDLGLLTVPEVRPDAIVQIPQPYTPDATLSDDYRCFLINLGLQEDRFLTAYTVQPGQPSIVHHVILFRMEATQKQEALRLDAEDEELGWQCFGGPRVGAVGLDMAVGSWTPGSVPAFFPEGTGYELKAGTHIIMQVHYNLSAGVAPDQTQAIFQYADEGVTLEPLFNSTLFAPVEIPCPAGTETPECDREVALEAAIAEDGNRARIRTEFMLERCNKTPEDYLNQEASAVVSSCDFGVAEDRLVLGSIAHMHTLGTTFRLELNPDRPDGAILLDIPAWDFHWQGSYLYEQPIPVEAGDIVRITCTWDNSHADDPRYILWGEGTTDEMCLGSLMTRKPLE